MNVENHFDAPLTALLQEMAGDLSFALDNIDRDQARADAEERSKQHERQLSGIIETAMDAIITVDARERIVLFNKAASAIFRIDAKDAIGLPLNDFIPRRLHPPHSRNEAEVVQTGTTSRLMGLNRELVAVRADGSEFPIEASISKLGEGGDALATIVLRDTTQAKEAERLRTAQMESEAANQAKTQFLSRISHEFRTPLNAILGFSKLLQASIGSQLGPLPQAQMSNIIVAGDQLRALIDDVLDVSRIEAGALTVEIQDVDVYPLIDEVVQLAVMSAKEHHVVIHPTYQAQPPMALKTDPVRLKQVLTNLVSNAIKYNRKGGSVTLNARPQGALATIEVVDTGIGMSPEQLARLYQPFDRLGQEKSRIEGTGIGLVLSREIVELLGGRLEVQSERGKGSTVTVSLPNSLGAIADSSASVERVAPLGSSAVPVSGLHPPLDPELSATVCYIEDNPINVELVRQLLARLPGVHVLAAATGREGVQLVQDHLPDLILLDMQLPDTTGLEVLRLLKDEPSTRKIPVIALSASAMSTEVAEAKKAGVDAYWTKPLDFDNFVSELRGVLKHIPSR